MLVDTRGNPITRESHAEGLTREQVVELVEIMREEMVREAITPSDLDILRDELGWDRISPSSQTWGIGDSARVKLVRQARLYASRDGASKQIIRLWTDFAVHKGLTVKATADSARKTLRKFWRGRDNRMTFGFLGQRKSSDRLLCDGELFFAVGWPTRENAPRVRRIDPLRITQIVTDIDDESEIYYYRYEYEGDDGRQHKLCYRDLYGSDDIPEPGAFEKLEDCTLDEDAKIYHIPLNPLGTRGASILTTTMEWSKAHRIFMRARAAIERALAQFAWKEKIKGGSEAVSARIASLRSGLVTGSEENNPPPAPTSVWVENMGLTREAMKFDTGAQGAQIDGSMLLMMAGLGAGVFPQYFGSGESFRLATATSMELPVLKQFECYQALWCHAYNELLDYAHGDATPGTVETDEEEALFKVCAPPIVDDDVPRLLGAIAKVFIQMPVVAEDDSVREWILTMLGVEDAEDVVKAIRKAEEKKEKEKPEPPPPQLFGAHRQFGKAPGEAPPEQKPEEAFAEVIYGLRNFGRVIEAAGGGNGSGNDSN